MIWEGVMNESQNRALTPPYSCLVTCLVTKARMLKESRMIGR